MEIAYIQKSKNYVDPNNIDAGLDLSDCEKSFIGHIINDSRSALSSVDMSRRRINDIMSEAGSSRRDDNYSRVSRIDDGEGRKVYNGGRGRSDYSADDDNSSDYWGEKKGSRDDDRRGSYWDDDDKHDRKKNYWDHESSYYDVDKSLSREQRASSQIKNLFSHMDINEYERVEDLEDNKFELLEEIHSLKESITEGGGRVDDIPEVTDEDSMEDIRKVYRKAKCRNNVQNYAETGGNLIMISAQALGKLFNGKRKVLGFQPNFSTWAEKCVRPKLRRIKPETTTMVSNAVEYFGISGGQRIVFELLPSLIVHGATQTEPRTSAVAHGDYVDASADLLEETEE